MTNTRGLLDVVDITAPGDLPAGPFGAWLDGITRLLAGAQPDDAGMDVPCGSCSACCRSSQFVHVADDERDALAHIPSELLFPAPGRPGERVLGYDHQGRCPMLGDEGCTIYPHRPRACRRYDCRLFAATDLDPARDGRAPVAEQARRWRFAYENEFDRRRHAAVILAARLVSEHGAEVVESPPLSVTALALTAVRTHHQVLAVDAAARTGAELPTGQDMARALLTGPLDETPEMQQPLWERSPERE